MRINKDTNGDAIVEATILFPIMIMVFAALVLLSVYLPTRAVLQRATQYAATTIAVEKSDTWLFFDESSMSYRWETDKSKLDNVYVALFAGGSGATSRGEAIAAAIEGRSVSSKAGDLKIECCIVNRVVYKEVVVTAERVYTIPKEINLSLISFPREINIAVTSTAVVQNGDEFVRNMDLAADFIKYISVKFGLTDIGESISTFWGKVSSILGW